MIVRIGCMYASDWDFTDYEEGELITIPHDAIAANYQILEDPDEDESDREGDMPPHLRYQLKDGELKALVNGRWVPCEDGALDVM